LLPRLAVPLGPLLLAAALGDLSTAAAVLGLTGPVLPTTGEAAVAVVMAAADYPDAPRKGDVISGLEEAARAGATIFHAGTVRGPDGQFRTNGGRVLSVVGLGDTMAAARQHAEGAAALIGWQGMQRRHDIAAKLPPAASTPAASTPAGSAPAATPLPISATGWSGAEGRT
jgi:phosphoribosylamine--glycine ligase